MLGGFGVQMAKREPLGHNLAPPQGEEDSHTSVPMANWGPDGCPTGPPSSRVQEQICGVEPRHSRQPRERGFHGNPPPPQGTWAPRVPAAAAERGGRGGRGIAQRWRSGPPLIPPSQTLIRLQMADGSPPFPHFPNKGREGAAHWTPVTLSQYQLEGTSVNLHRMWGLIFSPLTRAETEVQRGKGIGPRAG